MPLQVTADYTEVRNRDIVTALPPASDLILLAFPERFVRDPVTGVLTGVDIRPVQFARENRRELRYGFNLNLPLGGGDAVEGGLEDESEQPRRMEPIDRPGDPDRGERGPGAERGPRDGAWTGGGGRGGRGGFGRAAAAARASSSTCRIPSRSKASCSSARGSTPSTCCRAAPSASAARPARATSSISAWAMPSVAAASA